MACVLVLCGVPAAGKTKLALDLKTAACTQTIGEARSEEDQRIMNTAYCCYHICFDKLYPDGDELTLIDRDDEVTSRWKRYRTSIASCVRLLALKLSKCEEQSLRETISTIPADLLQKFLVNVCKESDVDKFISNKSADDNQSRALLIIDDNMYYRSMRYDYYQLAREFNYGFCQVFLQCAPEVALERNRKRAASVPDYVILDMINKLEPVADAAKHDWQHYSLTINTDDPISAEDVRRVVHLVETAINDPVTVKLVAPDPLQQQQSRHQCSKSQLHQTDLILRRLASDYLKALNPRELNMKAEAARVGAIKASVLCDIEAGDCQVSVDVLSHIEGASQDMDNLYFCFVKNIFDAKLK